MALPVNVQLLPSSYQSECGQCKIRLVSGTMFVVHVESIHRPVLCPVWVSHRQGAGCSLLSLTQNIHLRTSSAGSWWGKASSVQRAFISSPVPRAYLASSAPRAYLASSVPRAWLATSSIQLQTKVLRPDQTRGWQALEVPW